MFQSAGRIWGFRNGTPGTPTATPTQFQSAGRIWGFRNIALPCPTLWIVCGFNPPGGFGAFGTNLYLKARSNDARFQSAGRIWGFRNYSAGAACANAKSQFQSAGRIWGFRNPPNIGGLLTIKTVSIRRADLGLSEPTLSHHRKRLEPGFQSAGRIWGFRNSDSGSGGGHSRSGFNPPGGFGAFGTIRLIESKKDLAPVSIRRADLGLSEREIDHVAYGYLVFVVSIRRADLGLSELPGAALMPAPRLGFNPPGGFGAFGTYEA